MTHAHHCKKGYVNIVYMKDKESVFNISDLEGRWELLERSISQFNKNKKVNQQINIITQDNKEQLQIPDGIKIFFGGDTCDKGPSNLRMRTLFVNTKKNYMLQNMPDKLILIGGNRDYNHIRYHKELHVKRILETLSANKKPEWVPKNIRITFAMYSLYQIISAATIPESLVNEAISFKTYKTAADKYKYIRNLFFNDNSATKNKLILHIKNHLKTLHSDALKFMYLEWMNTNTMGRIGTIGYIRQELWCNKNNKKSNQVTHEEKNIAIKDITDKEVLNYITDSNSIKEYLELTQVAAKVGNDAYGYKLFVHGGVSLDSLTIGGKSYNNLDKWIAGINNLAQEDIEKIYSTDYSRIENSDKEPYSELERISLPNGITGQKNDKRIGTPITLECWKNKKIKLNNDEIVEQLVHYLDPQIIKLAENVNINGFATGHKPTGNSELGSAYTLIIPGNPRLFTLTTVDVTFGFNLPGKETCYALYTWENNVIDVKMTSFSNKLNNYITTNLATSVVELNDGPKVGSILYTSAPGETKTHAWNIIVLNKDNSGQYTQMILQRIEEFCSIQIVTQDKSEIKKLLSSALTLQHQYE